MSLAYDPNVICIVESWVCADISDEEISLPNYSAVRLDRNRQECGIIMYIKYHFSYDVVFSGPFVLKLICSSNQFLGVCAFYRPPSSPVSTFLYVHCISLVIVGDFNVNNIMLSNYYYYY